jgi:hypothetical protein
MKQLFVLEAHHLRLVVSVARQEFYRS